MLIHTRVSKIANVLEHLKQEAANIRTTALTDHVSNRLGKGKGWLNKLISASVLALMRQIDTVKSDFDQFFRFSRFPDEKGYKWEVKMTSKQSRQAEEGFARDLGGHDWSHLKEANNVDNMTTELEGVIQELTDKWFPVSRVRKRSTEQQNHKKVEEEEDPNLQEVWKESKIVGYRCRTTGQNRCKPKPVCRGPTRGRQWRILLLLSDEETRLRKSETGLESYRPLPQ